MCGRSLFQNADVEPGIKDNYWSISDVNAKIIGRFSPFLMSAIGH